MWHATWCLEQARPAPRLLPPRPFSTPRCPQIVQRINAVPAAPPSGVAASLAGSSPLSSVPSPQSLARRLSLGGMPAAGAPGQPSPPQQQQQAAAAAAQRQASLQLFPLPPRTPGRPPPAVSHAGNHLIMGDVGEMPGTRHSDDYSHRPGSSAELAEGAGAGQDDLLARGRSASMPTALPGAAAVVAGSSAGRATAAARLSGRLASPGLPPLTPAAASSVRLSRGGSGSVGRAYRSMQEALAQQAQQAPSSSAPGGSSGEGGSSSGMGAAQQPLQPTAPQQQQQQWGPQGEEAEGWSPTSEAEAAEYAAELAAGPSVEDFAPMPVSLGVLSPFAAAASQPWQQSGSTAVPWEQQARSGDGGGAPASLQQAAQPQASNGAVAEGTVGAAVAVAGAAAEPLEGPAAHGQRRLAAADVEVMPEQAPAQAGSQRQPLEGSC